ncbi:hypothetical protein [Streptomyces acidiscabies]|uniref:hypothetical protein n=1 Tax=Streptomyces acidiscabies TaxID=42234 RepID=UPI00073E35F2|nr:hypothetical protein [Streptomyces acidiscabies]GAQ52089.1 hypothetical protein a10_01870 [Streptomyces acidiscabies]
MGITIRLVGGPADGRTYKISDPGPPPLYEVVVDVDWPEFLSATARIPRLDYEPIFDHGWPRRADDGAYLYQLRSTRESVGR